MQTLVTQSEPQPSWKRTSGRPMSAMRRCWAVRIQRRRSPGQASRAAWPTAAAYSESLALVAAISLLREYQNPKLVS